MATKNQSGNGVIVACKLPHGLHLDIDTPDGVQRITLAGGNSDNVVGGYGITENVDSALLEQWIKKNGSHPMLKNNQMFVTNNMGDARAKADEQSEILTGFEGIDLDRLPPGIETADSQKK